jgi:ribose/xylose/arabinose/galactoside ABC-type transport system permease subunit
MSVLDSEGRVSVSDEVLLPVIDRMIWPLLAVVSLGVYVLVPSTFSNLQSIELILHGSVGLGFLVLAESVCLISGHFDLSVGSIAGFSAMVAGLALSPQKWGLVSDPAVGVLVILLVGTAAGVFNGVMVGKVGINPFLQTLATLIIFEGAKLSLSTVTVATLPDAYVAPGNESITAIALLFAAFLLVGALMRYTNYGQAIYALGSDEESARAVGIDTDRLVIGVYAFSGLLSGFGGLMLTGYASVVPPDIGSGLVFQAFAAAVIGGISLFGGRGKITGALGGVALLGLIQAALVISGTPPERIQLLNGVVLFVAILLYNTQTRLRERILSTEA